MYRHVVLGGTFDHLHAGHKDLLDLAFSCGQKVTLGLTKASMNRSKQFAEAIQSYALRERALRSYAASLGREKDLRIIPIKDIYGTTLHDQTLEAIIITEHSLAGAEHINQEREKKGLSSLAIKSCMLRKDESGEILCSSNIRTGIVNRNGVRFDVLMQRDWTLSQSAKALLRRPYGKPTGAVLLRQEQTTLFLIGDVVTQYCLEHQVPFFRGYIDGQSRRQPFSIVGEIDDTQMHNPAGTIQQEVSRHILSPRKESSGSVYRIHGEEDLLTVAAVMLLPLGSRVVYGYPYHPQRMRCIRVSEKMKNLFSQLLFLTDQ